MIEDSKVRDSRIFVYSCIKDGGVQTLEKLLEEKDKAIKSGKLWNIQDADIEKAIDSMINYWKSIVRLPDGSITIT